MRRSGFDNLHQIGGRQTSGDAALSARPAAVGNTAVIVKLFRVLLMLSVVLFTGWLFARRAVASAVVKIPVPVFALVFVALCVINSIAAASPALAPGFALIKMPLIEASYWGLVIAIAALGLGTSLTAIAALGWRHVAIILGHPGGCDRSSDDAACLQRSGVVRRRALLPYCRFEQDAM